MYTVLIPLTEQGRPRMEEECCWSRSGANTPGLALNLAAFLARTGERVRLVYADRPPEPGSATAMVFSWIFGDALEPLAREADILVANPSSSAPVVQARFPHATVYPANLVFRETRDTPLPVHLLDPARHSRVLYQYASGCPWRCSFCVWAHAYTSRNARLCALDINRLVELIPRVLDDPTGESCFLLGNEITGKPRWLEDFCNRLPDGLTWNADANIRNLAGRDILLAHAAGLRRLTLGVEFLENLTLAELGKGHTVGEAFDAMAQLEYLGVRYRFSLRQGIGETPEAMDALLANLVTMHDCAQLHPDHVTIGPMAQWPGAEWPVGDNPLNLGTDRYPRLTPRLDPEIAARWADVATLCAEYGWT